MKSYEMLSEEMKQELFFFDPGSKIGSRLERYYLTETNSSANSTPTYSSKMRLYSSSLTESSSRNKVG